MAAEDMYSRAIAIEPSLIAAYTCRGVAREQLNMVRAAVYSAWFSS